MSQGASCLNLFCFSYSFDGSLRGYKKFREGNEAEADVKVDEIIRNTYRTLMTRGMKGCYVYFEDKKTAEYFKKLIPTN